MLKSLDSCRANVLVNIINDHPSMKTSTKVLIAILILTPAILISNANSSTSYMPLRVGNSWTYTVFINMSYCCKEKFTIVSDTVINGKSISGALTAYQSLISSH
ncbi:MAG: hypothetical protein IPG99_14270 [Ignavibacteria bacterium]|nr:hypothetical protein [Ignavibacteria bacterium]